MTEVWLPVALFPLYAVSEDGQVKNRVTGKILKPFPEFRGYLRVNLCNDGARQQVALSRLVCTAFNGESPGALYQAAHRNGDKTDNRAVNLYWVLPEENARDRVRHGTASRGSAVHRKLTAAAAREIRASGDKLRDLVSRYGVSLTMIVNIRSGKSWQGV